MVTTMADYTPEVVRWFVDLGDTLKYETSDGLYTRILAIVSDESVGGTGRSLTVKRNVYGDPGTVDEGGN
jgi:hypothetical protein